MEPNAIAAGGSRISQDTDDGNTTPNSSNTPTTPIPAAPLAVAPPDLAEGAQQASPRRSRRRAARTVHAAIACGLLIAVPAATQVAARAQARAAAAQVDRMLTEPDPARDQRTLTEALAAIGADPLPISLAPGGAAPAAPDAPPAPVAVFDGLELTVPSSQTELVGFHESLSAAAPDLTPQAPPQADLNARPVPPPADGTAPAGEPPLVVLPSRDRPGGPTSAMDIAVPAGDDVHAPVTGTVRMAAPYTLYGKYPDVHLEIEPDGRPDLRVVVIHVDEVRVQPGDRVVAGETPIAGTARQFPFASQVDRFVDSDGQPATHVHVELKRS